MTPSPIFDDLRRPVGVPRPSKRTRVVSERPLEDGLPTLPMYIDQPPVDHIFITDGLAKKPVTKKVPLSCAECRRLKLKCDRVFPCKSCTKRGCQDICPAGVLVSGKGTRFILANTEQLHVKINEMSERIRQLEDAVLSLQSQLSDDPHPLLNSDLLEIKSALGLYGGTQTGSSQTSVSSSVHAEEHQEVDSFSRMEVDTPECSTSEESFQVQDAGAKSDTSQDQFMSDILQLSHRFPLGIAVSPEPDPSLRERMRQMLPSRSEAHYLWQQARQNALWQYNPHSNETFMPNLIHHVYSSPTEDLCPRRLALLFMILAVGCLVDLDQPPDSPEAEKYHNLARASLSEIPVFEDTTVDAILVLFYMTWYLLVFSDKKKAAGYAWGIMGLTANLAQSIGLHRESAKSKVIPEEVEKRRTLFWELMYLDARLSLSLGRPPSLCANFTDCNMPTYLPDEGVNALESLHHYHDWKHSCYVNLLSPLLEVISSPTSVYSKVLGLDKKIRNFPRPQIFETQAICSRPLAMQRASLSTALDAALLQLHRTFFVRTLSGPEETFDRRHRHAPSVVAVFLSASRMIATLEDLYRQEPELSSRILWFWSNAFSAAVSLCLLVSRAPFICLSPAALLELERARILFNAAKDRCPRAMQVILVLEMMVEKANHIYEKWSQGQEMPVFRHFYDSHNGAEYMNGIQRPQSSQESRRSTEQEQRLDDPFTVAHLSLSQAIDEAHQRAATLFPMRKPCQCSRANPGPPSHSWSPPPEANHLTPVLPNLYLTRYPCPPSLRLAAPSQITSVPSNSRMAVVETLNFDFGALNPSWNDQSWMAWF